MCKFNKPDSLISKRTTRYLKRTIKKNEEEILNDKNHIKSLNKWLEYMTNYAIYSYNYNNYLVDIIKNLSENVEDGVYGENNDNSKNGEERQDEKHKNLNTEQSDKITIRNGLYNEDICSYV